MTTTPFDPNPRCRGSNPTVSLALALLALVLGSIAPAAPADAEGRPASGPGASWLDSALDRTAGQPGGTYVLGAASLEPAPAPFPLLVQVDAERGRGALTRVTVVLGGELPQGSDVGIRIAVAGAERRVVASADVSGQSGPVRLLRAFDLGPGRYEVRAAAGQPSTLGTGLVSVKSVPLVVPDLAAGELTVTPIVLGDAAEAAAKARAERALVFGRTALRPATAEEFSQRAELDVAFRVFNWKADPGQKPDLTAEYAFYQKAGDRLRFFNRMKPQRLGAETLGEAFDAAAGVVAAGMAVPLEPFPLGEFQLAVRVTDNTTRQSDEVRVGFRVVP